MNYIRVLVLLSVLFVSAFGESNVSIQQSLIDSISKIQTKTKTKNAVRVMVRVKEGTDAKSAYQSLFKSNGIQANSIEMVKSFSLVGAKVGLKSIEKKHILVLSSTTLSEDELLAQAKKINGAELVEVDHIVHATATPNDARYPELWGMHNDGSLGTVDADIDAPEAWDIHRGSRDVVVGIIDTGVDYTHEDLVNNIWTNPNEIAGNGIDDDNNGYIDDIHGIDAINDNGDPMDSGSHGTHTAGTIGGEGNNTIGVVGVNWTTSIAACKFLDNGGSTSDAIQCVNYFTDLKLNRGINVVVTNNSWGGGGFSQALHDAIATAGDNGILFAAAAGNDGYDNDATPSYPASYEVDSIIAVAATDSNDNLASFSQYGVTSVDLAAPGVSIMSTIDAGEASCTPNSNQVFYTEGFESNLSNWDLYTEDTTNSGVDLPSEHMIVDDSDAYAGTYSLADTLAGTYNSNRLQSAILKDNLIDLSAVSAAEVVCVSLYVKGEVEKDWDFAYLSVSSDGGASWTQIATITGVYDDWTNLSVSLDSSYFVNNLKISLVRTNDDSQVRSGYNIDELKISTGTLVTAVSNRYGSKNGTSMATPHVAGAIALLAAAAPNKTSAEIKEIILSTVDPIASLEGIVLTAGRLNINSMLLASNDSSDGTLYSDLNGDGYSDILVENTVNFNLNAWFGSEDASITSNFLTTLSEVIEVVGRGDINGDGFVDIIVRNDDTGRLVAFTGNDAGTVTPQYLKTLTANQEVLFLTDMNGDGYDDIIIKNTVNLRVNALLGSEDGTVSNQYLKTLNPPQEIIEDLDINGDGYMDIIVKNNNNRRVNAWISDENASVHNQYLKTLPPTVEVFEGGDFNNDGYDDLLVQNTVNLRVNVWLSDESGTMTNQYLKTLSPNLDIAGLADINGDGFLDVIVSNRVNNRVNAWMNNSGTGVTSQYLKTLGVGATLVDDNDINGDGYDDLLVQNTSGRVSAWLGSETGTVTNKYLKTLSENQEIVTD